MKFTYYGHSCFAIEAGGKKFLFDPFVSGNELAAGIVDVDKIEADYILVSHGHGDHIADLIPIAKRTNALVITTYEIYVWLQAKGITNVHPVNIGTANFDFGKLRIVAAAHSSALPDGTYAGNPLGFVLHTDGGVFYYSGDTGLTMDMKLIPMYAKLDFAILPIGGNFTMDAEDAAIAAGFIQCSKVIGVHFDTFGFIKIDHQVAKEKFRSAGKELILPQIGESIEL